MTTGTVGPGTVVQPVVMRIFTVVAAIVLAVATACSSTGVRTSGNRRGDQATTPTTRPATTAPTTAPTTLPSRPPSPGPLRTLVSRLELPVRQLPAGGRVQGVLVVENGTDAPVELSRGCAPKWAVVLSDSRTATPDVAFTTECRPGPPLALVPGTSRLPFTLSGVVWACRPPTATIVPPPTVCLADLHEAPAPGRYFAVLVGLPAVPRPARIEVRITE